MSLLIKALQKAEQSKEKSAGKDAPAEKTVLELAPHHEEHSPEAALADAVSFYGKPHATNGSKTSAPSAPPAAERTTAANLFRAHGEAATHANRRAFWLGLIGLTLLLALGVGFYFYLQTLQQPEVVIPRTVPLHALEQAAAPAAAPVVNEPPQPPMPAPAAVEPAAAAEPPSAEEPKAVPSRKQTAESASAKTSAAEKPDAEEPLVQASLSGKSGPSVNATAMAAYQAWTAGDDSAAQRLYRQLLQSDPRNTDALLGLAAIAGRRGNSDEAAQHYLRILELDPKNSVAQAGIIALASQADPAAAESRLKSLLAQQPEAAYLHAALGGVYASQNQWPDAQQAYFQAFRLAPSNAEHAFNLAISLDQLGKPELALDYYQRARELLPREQGGAVDRKQLDTRIAQLRSALGK